LLAANPFKALAGIGNVFLPADSFNNHVVFLHVANAEAAFTGKTKRYIDQIRGEASNHLFIHTGNPEDRRPFGIVAATEEEYQIIQKAGIQTGILYLTSGNAAEIQKMNRLACSLKEDKNCQMVVCISQLPHQSKTGADNLQLAAGSEHLDMIISNPGDGKAPKTMVVANKKRAEVLLQYSRNHDLDCGKIEFAFNDRGEKRYVHYATKLYSKAQA
jgi:hypothetical protein